MTTPDTRTDGSAERLADTIIALEEAEAATELTGFDEHDAWQLGCSIRDHAAEHGLRIMIDIRRPWGTILFRAALPGATANHEDWIARKVATVRRFEESSALVGARLAAEGADLAAVPWLPAAGYVLAGGGYPIRVRGAGLVAVVSVSGMSAEADHDLIVHALARYRKGE